MDFSRKRLFRAASRRFRLLALVVIVCQLIACSTTVGIPPQREAIRGQLEPGNHVRVTTRDGVRHSFAVQGTTDSAIVGDQDRIAYEDIMQIEKEDISGLKTAGCVLSILGSFILLAVLIAQKAGPAGFPGPGP